MQNSATAIKECSTLKEIVKIFMNNQQPYFYVVSDNNRLEGSLSTHHVKGILSATESLDRLIIAKDLLTPSIELVTPDMTLANCMRKFEQIEAEHLPVIENIKNRKLIGSVSKREIIKLYNREILRKDVLGIKYVRDFESEKRRNLVQLPKEFKVEFIAVPEALIGKSIKEANIRAVYNITILAVKQKFSEIGQSNEMPDPGRIFKDGDILVAAGKKEDVEKFRVLASKASN